MGPAELHLTHNQEEVLHVLSLVVPVLSFCGSVWILLSYNFFARLRSYHYVKLIFWLSLVDAGSAIGDWMYGPKMGGLCLTQAILVNYFDLAYILWLFSCCVTLLRYMSDKQGELTKNYLMPRTELVYAVTNNLIPLTLTIIALSFRILGNSAGWCWVKTGSPDWWRWLLFYGWLFAAWVVSFFSVIRSIVVLMGDQSHASSRYRSNLKYSRRLVPYLLIFVLIWLWGGSNRIHNAASSQQLMWLYVLQLAFAASAGFFNAVAFGYSHPLVVEEWKNFLFRCKSGLSLGSKTKKLYVQKGYVDKRSQIRDPGVEDPLVPKKNIIV